MRSSAFPSLAPLPLFTSLVVALFAGCGSDDSGGAAQTDASAGGGGSSGSSGAGGTGGFSGTGGGGTGGSAGSTGGNAGTGAQDAGVGGTAGSSASGGSGAAPNDASVDSPDVSFGYDAPSSDVELTEDSACAAVSAEATLVVRPMDIIIIVDNSGSMGNEIASVEANINQNFASIISASGIDYRVILIAEHGEAAGPESICIDPPLNSAPCANPVPTDTQPAINPPVFYHYDNNDVESHDSWCKMLNWFDQSDRYGLAPNGWGQWLRDDSFKVFIEITDDGVNCSYGGQTFNDGNSVASGQTAATAFDTALLARSPTHFGTAAERNYMWYSIIGIGPNTPSTEPWLPTDPVNTSECNTAADPGTGYQALSNLTGGLKFPVCEGAGFDSVFQAIAEGVVQGAAVPCEFGIPTLDAGIVDPSKVKVEYTPGNGDPPIEYTPVADEAACAGGDGFYYDDPNSPTTVTLCPATCATVQADDGAAIQLLLGCLGN